MINRGNEIKFELHPLNFKFNSFNLDLKVQCLAGEEFSMVHLQENGQNFTQMSFLRPEII